MRLLRAVLVALAVLALASPLAVAHATPASLTRSTGTLYPVDDGTLAASTDGEATACVSLDGSGSRDSASFETALVDGRYHPASHTVTLPLDLAASDGGPAASGTGFRIEGDLSLGNGTSVSTSRSYAANAQVNASHLTFEIGEDDVATGQGNLSLQLALVPEGQGAVNAGQDVQLLCNAAETRIDRFEIGVGPVGAKDRDGDGIPDLRDPEITAGSDGGGFVPARLDPWTIGGFGLAAAATAFGAGMLPMIGRGLSARRLHLLLGLSAGLLLTVAFAKMIPRAMQLTPIGGWLIVAVFGGLLTVEWFLGGHGHDHGGHDHEHDDEEEGHAARSLASGGTRVALIALIAMSLHRFVGGLSMPAAFGLDQATGVAVVGALMAHQIPDGLAAASLFLAGGWSETKVRWSVAGIALWVPVGALAGLAFIEFGNLLPQFLALSAGTFLYIATVELIPELKDSDHRLWVGVGFLVGVVLAWALVVQLTKLV